MPRLIGVFTLLFLWSCGSNLTVMPAYTLKKSSKDPAVFSLDRLKATAGETVEVSGINLSDDISVRIGGAEVPLASSEKSWGSFVMPADADANSISATFFNKNKIAIATFALVNTAGEAMIPVMDADPAIVCSDIIFHDPSGNLKTGSRNCASTLPFCQSEGDSACVTNPSFPSLSLSALSAQANRIRSGTTIAGVVGTLKTCAVDGDLGCIVEAPSFTAALSFGSAGKILSGQSVAGISGTASVPAIGKVLSGTTYGLSGTALTGTLTLPLASNVKSGTSNYGESGNLLTPSFSPDFPSLANVRTTDTVDGVAGTLVSCNSDNGTNCVTSAAYPSVVLSNVTAGVVKNETTIAGVSGLYPNSTYPLAGSTATADLDSATFNAKIKSATAFEYFDSTGALQTGAGNANLTAANIKDGVSIFGSTGTFGADCTADAAVGCLTTSVYKAVNTSALSVWDIRYSKIAGGIAGTFTSYQDSVNLGAFNRTTGTGSDASATVADVYDTITNGWGGLTNAPAGFVTTTAASWVRDATTDNGNGGGTASNGICDGS